MTTAVDLMQENSILRQQIIELTNELNKEDALSSTLQDELRRNSNQLALRDLEIVKLREAFEALTEVCVSHVRAEDEAELAKRYLRAKQALSTPFTPEHLNAWLKEKLGEPVAWVWDDDGYDMYTNDFEYRKSIQKYKPTIPLYSVKEIV